MSSRVAACGLILSILFCATDTTPAEGWAAIVAATDRSDNPALLSLMAEIDLDGQEEICRALGRRQDPYVGDVLSALASDAARKGGFRAEYLLRVLLASILDEPQNRVEANEEALGALAQQMPAYEDAQIEGSLIQVLPMLKIENRAQLLMAAGSRIVARLRRSEGLLDPPHHAVALEFLGAVLRMPNSALADPCVDIIRNSRAKDLVERARAAIRALPRGG